VPLVLRGAETCEDIACMVRVGIASALLVLGLKIRAGVNVLARLISESSSPCPVLTATMDVPD
jgi:hypothetical protein